MAREPVFNLTSTDRGWKVEIPSRFSLSGNRERSYFPTRDKAKEFAAKLKKRVEKHESDSSNIRPSVADDATLAVEMLKPFGLSLVEAAKRIVEIENAKAASKEVGEALVAFLLTKAQKGEAQRRAYEQMK